MKPTRRSPAALCFILAAAFLAASLISCVRTQSGPEGKLVARFLDVGQADAILVSLPDDRTILIDAATKSAKVEHLLSAMGIKRVDYLVLTHPHEDHIGGAAEVVENLEIGQIWMPRTSHTTKTYENLLLAIQAKGMQIDECKAGKVMIDDDNVKVVFAGPSGTFDDLNNMSAVLSITYGDVTLLFAGDAGSEAEKAMLKAGTVPDCDVLKVGHHGSSTSTSQDFLDTVKPSIAVIQVGAGNSYGHPSEVTLKRLREAGAEVYRTDLDGTVTVETDGKIVTVSTEKGAGQ